MSKPIDKYNINFIRELIFEFTKTESSSFSVVSWDVRSCGEDIVGYQGDYNKLNIIYEPQECGRKELNFFIKSLPKDEEKAKKLIEVGYFRRESGVYSKLLSEFDNLQVNSNYHPKSVMSSEAEIILEDIQIKGYTVKSSRQPFDGNHCEVALKSLARLHAGSIIYETAESLKERKQIKIEDRFEELLKECGYIYNGWYIAGIEAALAIALKNEKCYEEMLKPENMTRWRKIFEYALELCRPSKSYRNVLCHRDLWVNNLMFKYVDKNVAINCKMVDYQASICMPPAGDVVSLIYLNLDKPSRQNLYDHLIKYYYDILKEELSKSDLDILKEYMTFEDYKIHCEMYKVWGLVQALILHQLALLKPEDTAEVLKEENYDHILNVDRSDFVTQVLETDPLYKRRFMENVEEFFDLYITNNKTLTF